MIFLYKNAQFSSFSDYFAVKYFVQGGNLLQKSTTKAREIIE